MERGGVIPPYPPPPPPCPQLTEAAFTSVCLCFDHVRSRSSLRQEEQIEIPKLVIKAAVDVVPCYVVMRQSQSWL